MTKQLLKKIVATFVASVSVAAFAIALVPSMAEAKLTPFMKIIPGYVVPGYRAPVKVYRPVGTAGYRVTPVMKVVPGYSPAKTYGTVYRPGK